MRSGSKFDDPFEFSKFVWISFFTKDIKVLGILSLLISIEIFIVKKQVTGIYKTAEVDSYPWVLAKDMNMGKTSWAYI